MFQNLAYTPIGTFDDVVSADNESRGDSANSKLAAIMRAYVDYLTYRPIGAIDDADSVEGEPRTDSTIMKLPAIMGAYIDYVTQVGSDVDRSQYSLANEGRS